ncbi:MAG: SusD/RagB family nutrient-binding outer membrane lipoprotein [Candidatus Cryptobacteroides sp.]
MKNIIKISILAAGLALCSCSKWLDVNDNPNYVSDASAQSLLPTAHLLTADKLGYDITLVGSYWSQYVVQNHNTNQYTKVMNYAMTVSDSWFSSPWAYIYSLVLPNLKTALDKSGEGYSNYAYEAKAWIAYNIYLLNSLYGDVAWTEGPLADTFTAYPHFDDEKAVYDALLVYLEDLRTVDASVLEEDEMAHSSASADMIFGGDVTLWTEFVNSLYLKLLVRDFAANKAKIEAVLAEDALLSVDAAFDHFSDATDKSNPLYESDRRRLNTTYNILGCNDILGVLDASDPRLLVFYEGDVSAATYGTQPTQNEAARLRISPTHPVCFISAAEVEFLKAECYARLGRSDNAKACYEAGIAASFEACGLSGADAFIAGPYAFVAGDTESMVEQIINHKWASNVRCNPIESWFDINRTGYPKRGTTITDFDGTIGGKPYRYMYPEDSGLYNPNSPEVKDVTEKMWWHKQ